MTTPEGQKPIDEDEERRRSVLGSVIEQVKGLGEGTEKGTSSSSISYMLLLTSRFAEIEGFFNLLFSHFLTLYPLDAPETRARLDTLLKAIVSAPDHTSTKFRMYVALVLINALPLT